MINEQVTRYEEQIRALQRDYRELEQALSDSINVQEEMSQKENDYKRQIKELCSKIGHYQEQKETYFRNSDALALQNKKLTEAIYWLNEDLDDMKKKANGNEQLLHDQENLRSSLLSYAKNEEKYKRNENMLESKINELNVENSELKSKVEMHMQVCEQYKMKTQKEIEELKSKFANMIDIGLFREVELERNELKQKIAEDHKVINRLGEQLQKINESKTREIEVLKQKHDVRINKLIEEYDEQLVIHAEALEEEKEKLAEFLKLSTLEKEKLTGNLEELKQSNEQKSCLVESQIKEIEKLKELEQNQIQEIKEENQELIKTIEQLEKLIEEKDQKKIEELCKIREDNYLKEMKIKELQSSFDELLIKKNELEGEVEILLQEYETLETNYKTLEEEKKLLEKIDDEKVIKQKDNQILQESLEEEKTKNEKLSNEIMRANEKISQLLEKENVLDSQIEELNEYLQNSVKQEEYEILQEKIIALNQQISYLEKENKKPLKKEIENSEDEVNKYDLSQIKSLMQEKEKLENMNKLLKEDFDMVFFEFETLRQEQEKRFKKFSQIQYRVNNYSFNEMDNKNHLEDRQFQNPNNGVLAKSEDELEQEQTAIEINQPEKEIFDSENNTKKEHFQGQDKEKLAAKVEELLFGNVQNFSDKNCLTTKIENLKNISLTKDNEKVQLREEIQSFMSQLVEGSLEISQNQHSS